MDKFYALSEPKRREIIELLSVHGQLPATAIARNFDVSTAAISQHLKVLREAGLVHVRKAGQQRIYQLNMAALVELDAWVKQMTRSWNDRFDALDRVLKSTKSEEDNHGNR